ncbi:MAG: DUF418 domain-containing protein [Moheibacter sp.]
MAQPLSIPKEPVSATKRIAVVDFLRGVCLFGVVVSNFMAFQESGIEKSPIDRFLHVSEEIFFGPVWISLSFLFGFGFWILIQKSKNNYPVFLQRMFWLFLIGILNACLFHIDILRDFAVVGIFLGITPYFNKKTLLVFCVFLTVCIPILRVFTSDGGFQRFELLDEISGYWGSPGFWDNIYYNLKYIYIVQIQNPVYAVSVHFEMFCFFLWGVLASRYGIFQSEQKFWKTTQFTLIFSLCGILLIWMIYFLMPNFGAQISKIYSLKILMEIFFALFTLAMAALIYRSGFLKQWFGYIEIYGRMTLTNYLLQSVFSFLIFSGSGFGLGLNQPLWVYFILAVSVYLFQVMISAFWSKRFYLGPVEWLWRSLSQRKALPILKK